MRPDNSEDPIAEQIEQLQQPLKGRRKVSWILFSALLLFFLLIPIAASLLPNWGIGVKPVETSAQGATTGKAVNAPNRMSADVKSTILGLDTNWDPGQLATSHQPWANDCKVCHSAPFKMVKNVDCLACHKDMPDHVSKEVSQATHLAEMRCASCHRDHKGSMGLVAQNRRAAGDCVDCHADIKDTYAKAGSENVGDFADKHPAFRIQHAVARGETRLIRTRQAGKAMSEPTSLKFPHDVHLDAKGVNSPKGKTKMECSDCHHLNPDGIGFQTVTMKKDCQSCHDLKFEPSISSREVPHGPPEEVLKTLIEFYSYVGMHKVPVDKPLPDKGVSLIRPGKEERVASFVNAPGDVRARTFAAASQLFEVTTCAICHEVKQTGKASSVPGLPEWKVTPIASRHAWMPSASFNHAKHNTSQCTDCHASKTSKEASDILMPDIKACRDCHAGSEGTKNRLASDCGMCHFFHPPKQVPVATNTAAQPISAAR
jgi:Cytochrome c7 and related cytochrome c